MTIGPLEPSHPYPRTVRLETLSFGCRAYYRNNSILGFIYVYMARKWPLGVPKHVFDALYTYICDLDRFLKNRFFSIF